jgi:hypothetical protein
MIGIELKVAGNTPTKLQEVELAKIRQAGGVGVVIEDMASLEQLINGLNKF